MNDKTPVAVVFRVYRRAPRDVVALFPYETFDHRGHVTSYQHIGQHGGADYAGTIRSTRPATEEEYTPLLRELTRIGYAVRVLHRRGRV